MTQMLQKNASSGGFANTTGGDSYTSVTVSSLDELKNAVSNGEHHIIIRGTIYGGKNLTTLNFSSASNSNTTIEGESGGKAQLENIQLKFDGELLPDGENIQNIKISNLTFFGRIADLQAMPKQEYNSSDISKTAGINYEGISLRRVTNALITHCTIYDTSDDLMSVTLSSDYITLSYNHFYFSDGWVNMSPDPIWNWVGYDSDLAGERLAMVVGANSADSWEATKKLRVTLHHNWIGYNMRGRPLFRGWIHAYSNYFDNSKTYSDSEYNTGTDGKKYPKKQYEALQVNSGAVVYSESNYFYLTNNTNTVSNDGSGYNYHFFEKNNTYNQTTGSSVTGSNFSGSPVSYAYEITDSKDVPKYVMANAGPK
ncbi:TPA: hypothetical protein O4G09_005500 [Klebsiella michiganensis]|uniref:hypothetical protein n=1 Tax=Klebsiella pasteurii TaxID=2587529 RepID=UPI00116C3C23|nr:hypothetical protein [Klebsiella pasteurii]VUT14212.1 hypothetical protein SB6413_06007 [Klebsiella pasteurii]HCZ9102357.1 hypothetical protein [Klebsiella michiganensis]